MVVVKPNAEASDTPVTPPEEDAVVKPNDEAPDTPVINPEEAVVLKDDTLEAPAIVPDKEVITDDDNAPVSPDSPPQQEEVEEDVLDVVETDFILPNSNTEKLEESDLVTLTKQQLMLARNEIYARHGLVFKTEDIQTYFESISWYHEDASYESEIDSIENFNVQLIEKIEEINALPN